MKLMNTIAAATIAAGIALPAFAQDADDPFVSTQQGETAVGLTAAQTAGIVAGVIAVGAIASGGDSSTTTTTTSTPGS